MAWRAGPTAASGCNAINFNARGISFGESIVPEIRDWGLRARQLSLSLVLVRPGSVQTRNIWELVLGLDKGIGYFGLVIALLIYNIFRGFLTYRVGLLREAEERSGDSPAWKDYRRLHLIHRAASILFIVALGSFFFHAWHWMTQPVLLPG